MKIDRILWIRQSEKLIQTQLPINLPETYEINEETLADNFDLPKTFILEFEFKLELKGYYHETILVGMKYEKFSVIVFKPLGLSSH